MKKLANFALFQLVWFVAVLRAVDGDIWSGLAAAGLFLIVHLAMVDARDRWAELTYAFGVGLVGTALDTGLRAIGATAYPTSDAWTLPTAPPWIIGLWLAFALLPRFSLAWLVGRPWLAVACGAVGGPLSYWGGVRLGATGAGDPWRTYGALALEYALVFPAMLACAPARGARRTA